MEFILKSSLLIGVLYSFYKLFLQKETFFKSIRVYFITGLLLTVLFPLISIPIYIEVETAPNNISITKNNNTSNTFINNNLINENTSLSKNTTETIVSPTSADNKTINWITLLKNIYILGILFFSIKFLIEIVSLYKLVHKSNLHKNGNITFAETIKNISPFSIFNYIVYNKHRFSNEELNQIIEHEKVHVNHKHSYDMLLVQLLVIVQWFNPFAWLYKKDVEQNLEFLADQFAKENHKTLKEYQYLLLKTSIKNYPFALSTNFYNSLIKKRIIMLQKSPSKKLKQLKYILLLPLIALFLYAFNIKEIEKPIDENLFSNLDFKENTNITFVNPIHPANVIGISYNFGERINPYTNKKQFHKGIDIKAYEFMDVYATADGIVSKASYDKLKGNYIQIQHANNYQTNYHHLGEIQIALGEQVKSGKIISTVGNSGKSIKSHLHYEIVKDGKNIDPKPYVNFNNIITYKKDSKTSKKELKDPKTKSYGGYNILVNSNATPQNLQLYRKEFKEQNKIDLVFSKIKRNANGKIIAITIDAKNKTTNASYFYDQNHVIPNIFIGFDKNRDEITITKATFGKESPKPTKIIDNDEIKIIIRKNTTNKELEKIKSDLEKEGVEISFKKVKRNEQNEITFIKIVASTKNSDVSYENSGKNGIRDITLKFKENIISINDNNLHNSHFSQNEHRSSYTNSSSHSDASINYQGNDYNFSISKDNDENSEYFLNGKKVTKNKIKNLNSNNIKSISITKDKNIHVYTNGNTPKNNESSQTQSFSYNSDNDVTHDSQNSITYEGKTYFYSIVNNKTTFYTNFGETVANNLSKKLLKHLKKKLQ